MCECVSMCVNIRVCECMCERVCEHVWRQGGWTSASLCSSSRKRAESRAPRALAADRVGGPSRMTQCTIPAVLLFPSANQSVSEWWCPSKQPAYCPSQEGPAAGRPGSRSSCGRELLWGGRRPGSEPQQLPPGSRASPENPLDLAQHGAEGRGDETMVFCWMGPGTGEHLTLGFRGAAVFRSRSPSVRPTWRPPGDKSVNLLQSSTEISTENSHAPLSLPHVHLAFTHSNTDDNPRSQWLRAPLPRRTGLCSGLCLQPPASWRVQAGLCTRSKDSNQSSPGSCILPAP